MTQAVSGGRDAARDMFEADTASRALGIDLVETGPGTATARMQVTKALLNYPISFPGRGRDAR